MELSNSVIKLKSRESFLSEEFKQDKEKMKQFLTLLLNKDNDCLMLRTDNKELKEYFDHVDDIVFLRGVVTLDEICDIKERVTIRSKQALLQFMHDNSIEIEDYDIRRVYPRFIELNSRTNILNDEDIVRELFRFKGDFIHRIFEGIEGVRSNRHYLLSLNTFDLLMNKKSVINLVRDTRNVKESLVIAKQIADKLWEE